MPSIESTAPVLHRPRVATARLAWLVGRRERVALALAMAVAVIALALVLSQHPLVVVARNAVTEREGLVPTWRSVNLCQSGERLPAHTEAIRLSIGGIFGPSARVYVVAGSRLLTSGEVGRGWTGGSVTVPVRPLPFASAPVEICFVASRVHEGLTAYGTPIRGPVAARTGRGISIGGRVGIEFMRRGSSSWLGLASTLAAHMALGRGWSGTWVAPAIAILMFAAAALACALALGALARTPRRTMIACALVACLSAASWSLLTPPFQVPDEPAHFAYVKQLAETGSRPTVQYSSFAQEERFVLRLLESETIHEEPAHAAILSQRQQRRLELDLRRYNRTKGAGSGAAGVATLEPPLYYALEAIPYRLAWDGTLLDRLQLMRLFSALMAGLTTMFIYLFLRETLPSKPWAWTIGALVAALSPMLGFMSGSVNPDSLLCAIGAALFYTLAVAIRRGMSWRRATAICFVLAAGLLTKLSFIGLLPGVGFAACVLGFRALRERRVPSARAVALAGIMVGIPLVAGLVLSHPPLATAAETAGSTHGSPLGLAEYVWQLYLPRLPGMSNDFTGFGLTAREIWFDGYIGRFGWLDTLFPGWVYTVALVAASAILMLCLRSLLAGRRVLRRRGSELATYALMTLGVLVMIGIASYLVFPEPTAEYGQSRYLLPLLPLLGAVVALAARGAGQRWGRAAGALLVVLFLAHDVAGQLQTIARFYG